MPREVEKDLGSVIAELAGEATLRPDLIRARAQSARLSQWSEKRQLKALTALGRYFRARSQFGKLRAVLLTGTTLLGPPFLTSAERAGLLLCHDVPLSKFGQFIADLRTEIQRVAERRWDPLNARLATYAAYQQLATAVRRNEKEVIPLLRRWPRGIIKKVIAFTNLCFLRSHYRFDVPQEIADFFDELGPPEEVASCASLLIAAANSHRRLDSVDLGFPITQNLAGDDVRALMRYGKALLQLHEFGKDISLFGYSLEVHQGAERRVFCLHPPSLEFEYARRLGFIRSEIGSQYAPWSLSREERFPELSLVTAAEMFANRFREQLAEVMDPDTPFRRVRFVFRHPLDPTFRELITGAGFYDDFVARERLAQDFLIPLHREADPAVGLTENLDLDTFTRIWQVLRFLSLVDIALLRPYSQTDHLTFFNSLARVVKEQDFIEMIALLDIGHEQVRDFMLLVSADVHNLGYFDFQYRPFIRMGTTALPRLRVSSPPEIIHAPALVASSNIFRNVLSANQLRLSSTAAIFVDVVADMLHTRFPRVTRNRRIERDYNNTDIDVVIFEGKRLYLFECKHSLPPTGPHEQRDIWEDIEKGTRQLRTAMAILADPVRLHAYLAGWFPGTKCEDTIGLQIMPCVLCSHRIFSGMTCEGIPVRDFTSLARLVEDGTMGMGAPDEKDVTIMHRYRVTAGAFSATDLDDYLSVSSRYFATYMPFMCPVSRFERLGDVSVARETYVYSVDLESWRAHLEALGCVRLPDETQTLKRPISLDGLQTRPTST